MSKYREMKRVNTSADGQKLSSNERYAENNHKKPKIEEQKASHAHDQTVKAILKGRGSAIQRLFNQGGSTGPQMLSTVAPRKRFSAEGIQQRSPRVVSLAGIKKTKGMDPKPETKEKQTEEQPKGGESKGSRMVSLSAIKRVKVTDDHFSSQQNNNGTFTGASKSRGRSLERRKKTTGGKWADNRARSVSTSSLGTHEFRVATWLDRLAKVEAEKHSEEVVVQGVRWNALPRRRSRAEMRQARAMAEAAKLQAPSALRSARSIVQFQGQTKMGIPRPRKGLQKSQAKQLPQKASPKAPRKAKALPAGCIKIDGAMKEGGGQLIRNAVALAAITGRPLFINNIRGGRGRAGLRPQHCTGIQLVQQISQGSSGEGLRIGSQELLFIPGKLTQNRKLKADPRTAGSIALLLQIALPCFLFCQGEGISQVKLCGGTTVPFAPPIDHFTMVLYPLLKRMGIRCNFKIVKRGYYPQGGGEILFAAQSCTNIQPIHLLDQGDLIKIQAGVFCNAGAAKLDLLADKIEEDLRAKFPSATEILVTKLVDSTQTDSKVGKGATWGVQLAATTSTGAMLGADEFGDANLANTATQIARKAADKLKNALQSGACVDEHTADQLVVFMAFASESSAIRIPKQTLKTSKHLETSIHIAQLFQDCKFNLKNCDQFEDTLIVECKSEKV